MTSLPSRVRSLCSCLSLALVLAAASAQDAEPAAPPAAPPPRKGPPANFTPPRAIKQVKPIYPAAMRRFGITGEVRVQLELDASGNVQRAHVVQSDNPAFDDPAMESVLQWKFEPARRDGKPVATRLQVPLVFTININGRPGEAPYRIESASDQSKLPPELRYDTPPKIRGVLIPVYPYALRRENVRGTVKALVAINARGRVSEVKIQESPRPEFSQALTAALEGFRFDPARREGKPVPCIIRFEQRFDGDEPPDAEGEALLSLEKRHPERIAALTELDTPPQPVSQRPPAFPLALPDDVKEGQAVVECLIDKEGRARLPRIKSATHDAFGYAAVQAASTWRFAPPLAKGKPAVVRALLPFNFRPPPPPKAPRPAAEP